MAKSLKNYKRKEIRCLIVEDFETGKVSRVSEASEIEECLLEYSEHEVTKIFNPTVEQGKEINDIIERSQEGNKVYSKIDGVDMLIRVIPMITDIEVDLDKDEDIDLINEVISDPDEVINMVVHEVNSVVMEINLKWLENLKLLNELPDDVINVLADITTDNKNAEI